MTFPKDFKFGMSVIRKKQPEENKMKSLPIKLDLALTDIHIIGNSMIQGYPPDTVRMRKIGIYLKQLVREIRDEIRDL